MTALVFAPPPWHFYAFPLIIQWQASYGALEFYFPNVRFGLLGDQPEHEKFTSLLQAPRRQNGETLKRDYYPGELKQWQAFLDYMGAQEDHDETDLQAVIRGRLEPVLPRGVDRELLWSLAYQLEKMLSEEAAGLQRLAGQERALEKTLGDDLLEESEREIFQATLTPSLLESHSDPVLARVRYQFWRQVLAPHLNPSWAALVLEPAAGASSPRCLWEGAADEDQSVWQADFVLPDWRPQPDRDSWDVQSLQLSVEFHKILGELLQALTENAKEAELCREKMLRLVEERLWPLSGLPQAQSIHLEVFGWLKGADEAALLPEPMMFLTPAA